MPNKFALLGFATVPRCFMVAWWQQQCPLEVYDNIIWCPLTMQWMNASMLVEKKPKKQTKQLNAAIIIPTSQNIWLTSKRIDCSTNENHASLTIYTTQH